MNWILGLSGSLFLHPTILGTNKIFLLPEVGGAKLLGGPTPILGLIYLFNTCLSRVGLKAAYRNGSNCYKTVNIK